MDGPLDFMTKADNTDKAAVTKSPTFFVVVGAVVLALLLGLFFSYMEHSKPLGTFMGQTQELAKGKIEVLAPSTFSGAHKKGAAPPSAVPETKPASEVAVAESSQIQPLGALIAEDAAAGGAFDEMADWRKVYEEFLALKQQCGEPTSNLTFEKFKGTLQRNKD